MKTRQLIEVLAREAGPVPDGVLERRVAAAAVVGLALSVGLMVTLFGLRVDAHQSMTAIALKILFGVLGAAAVGPLLLEFARPNIRVSYIAVPALLFPIASLATAVGAFALSSDSGMLAWLGGDTPECLYRIPLLALPIAVALFFAVRGFGATRRSLAGAAIGAFSGSLASIAYAACCPMDSVLYVASWYLAAVLLCAAVGALVIGRALKW